MLFDSNSNSHWDDIFSDENEVKLIDDKENVDYFRPAVSATKTESKPTVHNATDNQFMEVDDMTASGPIVTLSEKDTETEPEYAALMNSSMHMTSLFNTQTNDESSEPSTFVLSTSSLNMSSLFAESRANIEQKQPLTVSAKPRTPFGMSSSTNQITSSK